MANEQQYTGFSVKQPWAGLLLAGIKKFEVRSWAPAELGPYFVHASTGRSPAHSHLCADATYLKALNEADMADPRSWPTGAILGVVNVRRIWEPGRARPRLTKLDKLLCGDIDGMRLWEIDGAVRFDEPIPSKGKLNLWVTEGSVSTAFHRALRRSIARSERL